MFDRKLKLAVLEERISRVETAVKKFQDELEILETSILLTKKKLNKRVFESLTEKVEEEPEEEEKIKKNTLLPL